MSYTVKHPVFLDCQSPRATGSFGAGVTTWSFTGKRPYDTALYLPTGEIITLSTANHTAFTASGNYSGGEAILGRAYSFEVLLPQPFLVDQNGIPEMSSAFQVMQCEIRTKDTIKFYVEVYDASKSPTLQFTKVFTDEAGIGSSGLNTFKVYMFPVQRRSDDPNVYVYIKSSYPVPVTVTGIQFEGFPTEVLR